MDRKLRGQAQKLLPVLLLSLYGGAALAFEPIKFDDGTVLDVSLQVSYQNLKRLSGPVRMQDYSPQTSVKGGVVSPSLVRPPSPLRAGTLLPNAVDLFTQLETKLNTDDGDLAVNKHGTISNRVSALMDFNLTHDNYRAFARLNSFRDQKIFQTNDNYSQGTFNGVGPSNEYSEEARRLAGQRTRLLDAYVQGRWKLGDDGSYPLFVKAGRQVVNWGEGLFFQGIGGAMNPNDQIKGMTPGIPAQEAFLPTEQIYGTLGLSDKLTLMAYKKWKFRETEMAPVGTYFSASDFLGPGARFEYALPYGGLLPWLKQSFPGMFAGVDASKIGNYGAWRGEDIGRTSKNQWGLALKYQLTDKTDIGLYRLNYTQTIATPQLIFGNPYWNKTAGATVSYNPAAWPATQRDPLKNPDLANAQMLEYVINALTPYNSTFVERFMNDIQLVGGSFSTVFGDWQVAGEMAYRNGAPLMNGNLHYSPARSRTVNANMSFLRAWSGQNFLWGYTKADNVILGGEVSALHLCGYDIPTASVNPWMVKQKWDFGASDPMFDKNAVAYVARIQLDYTPWPEWDLSVPIFYWRELVGNGILQNGWNSGLMGKGSSRTSIETKFTYKQNLELAMSLNYWLGDYDLRFHTMNQYADRDLVAFNATYHF